MYVCYIQGHLCVLQRFGVGKHEALVNREAIVERRMELRASHCLKCHRQIEHPGGSRWTCVRCIHAFANNGDLMSSFGSNQQQPTADIITLPDGAEYDEQSSRIELAAPLRSNR